MIRKVFGLSIAMAMCMLLTSECFAQSCSGNARWTPVRNLIAARPIRTATQNVFQKIAVSRSSSCSGSAHSVSVAPSAPMPASSCGCVNCSCGCEQGLPCTCSSSQETASYIDANGVLQPKDGAVWHGIGLNGKWVMPEYHKAIAVQTPVCINSTCSLKESQQSLPMQPTVPPMQFRVIH